MKEGTPTNRAPELPFPEEEKKMEKPDAWFEKESVVKCTEAFRNQPDGQIFVQIRALALLRKKEDILKELKELGFLEDEGPHLRVEEQVLSDGSTHFYIWMVSPRGTMMDSRNTTIDTTNTSFQ